MLVDARTVPTGQQFTFDLCIVGAGPAGITIAQRLAQAGLRIALLEGGGTRLSVADQAMFRGENAGHPTWPLHTSRFRVFGGAGVRWGGMSRPLDALDFTERPWIGGDAWPLEAAEVSKYDEDAAAVLGLQLADFDLGRWSGKVPPTTLAGGAFDPVLFQFSPMETRFGEDRIDAMAAAESTTVLLHANVVDIRLDPGSSRVGFVEVRTDHGGCFRVRATTFVLAGGAIENARLLLASRSDRPSGLGNEYDQVGRYFMDHLHVGAGHIVPTSAARDRDFFDVSWYSGVRMVGALAPTPDAQREHELLSTSMIVQPPTFAYGHPFLSWPTPLTVGPERLYRKLRRRQDVAADVDGPRRGFVKKIWYESRSLPSRKAARRAATEAGVRPDQVQTVYFRAEQLPNPSSRVTLSERVDAFGKPRAKLDWRMEERDFASVIGWLSVLDGHLRSRGLGRVILPAEGWTSDILGGPHHMGTTRMSASPRAGVVDADCKVHSVDNLFVAGSSVFTTGGYANPTFTLLSLALRLADHLAFVLNGTM